MILVTGATGLNGAELVQRLVARGADPDESLSGARAAGALLGTGGAIGLGSIVYALAVVSKCLNDDELLADAQLKVYPRCGHLPMVEARNESTRDLVAFLAPDAQAAPAPEPTP